MNRREMLQTSIAALVSAGVPVVDKTPLGGPLDLWWMPDETTVFVHAEKCLIEEGWAVMALTYSPPRIFTEVITDEAVAQDPSAVQKAKDRCVRGLLRGLGDELGGLEDLGLTTAAPQTPS